MWCAAVWPCSRFVWTFGRDGEARQAVAYLKTEATGAATFVPLETLPVPPEPTLENGSVRWAARAVRASHPALLHYLLGRVGIVDHLDEAEARWRRNGVNLWRT